MSATAQLAIPGMASLHSHAFQRGMAGLAEIRGDTTDTFWTWRETMYRFALMMTPDDVESVATLLYAEMLERGYTRRPANSHYLDHDDGTPYADPRKWRRALHVRSDWHRADPAAEFLAHGSFGGAAPHAGQRRFISSIDQFARLMDASRKTVSPLRGAECRRCTAQPARRDTGRN